MLAIDGKWGAGKSSLMTGLYDELERLHDDVKVVWFNAWRASGVNVLTVGRRRRRTARLPGRPRVAAAGTRTRAKGRAAHGSGADPAQRRDAQRGGDRYHPDECRASKAQLDESVPLGWRLIVDDNASVGLLRDLGGPVERQRFQQRLRRQPLITGPDLLGSTGSVAGESLSGIRLLWVDDNPAGNETVVSGFVERGAEVRTASDKRQAIEYVTRFAPNVLISDVSRHGQEVGFDDLTEIRAAGYQGPSIFFAARVSPTRITRAQAVGADGVVSAARQLEEWLDEIHRKMPHRST